MLFHSFIFPFFFLLVYGLYLSMSRSRAAQNILLLIASYVFYGYWDWRFLSLLALSTTIDFFVGHWLHRSNSQRRRKLLLTLSVCSNLAILGTFKYFGFFADSFAHLLNLFGLQAGFVSLNIVLPIGISFYTFQSMSYTIDIYRGKLTPSRSFVNFALFVAFFPQLVAGPIERAANLLPQINSPRKITAAHLDTGSFLILWGYFKKVVVADNLAAISDQIFEGYSQFHGIDLVIGVLAFSVQIYADFSGYSDIARGLAKLMGFDLMVNFKLPYFAVSPSDFWLRWHVSLSTWLRDYLYIPLGGNRHGSTKIYRNLAITMLLGSLWHGAAWNFVLWGLYHGVILIVYRIWDERAALAGSRGRGPINVPILPRMLLMLILTLIGWVFFRCASLAQIYYVFANAGLTLSEQSLHFAYALAFFTLPLLVVQVCQHVTRDLLIVIKLPILPRVVVYTFILSWIFIFGVRESVEFIYFQF